MAKDFLGAGRGEITAGLQAVAVAGRLTAWGRAARGQGRPPSVRLSCSRSTGRRGSRPWRGGAGRWEGAGAAGPRIGSGVRERVRNSQEMDRPISRAQFLAELRDVRRKAQQEGRFGPVSSLLKMEAQILGLFAPIELHITANPLGQKTDAELERIVAEEGDRLREAAKKKKAMPGDNVIEASFATADK